VELDETLEVLRLFPEPLPLEKCVQVIVEALLELGLNENAVLLPSCQVLVHDADGRVAQRLEGVGLGEVEERTGEILTRWAVVARADEDVPQEVERDRVEEEACLASAQVVGAATEPVPLRRSVEAVSRVEIFGLDGAVSDDAVEHGSSG